MRLFLLLLLAGLLCGEDAYTAWWRRVDAAVAAATLPADRPAILAARQADPPPADLPLGDALAHHRVLLAWLRAEGNARTSVGAMLSSVRAYAAASLRLLEPDLPLTPVPLAGLTPTLTLAMVDGAPALVQGWAEQQIAAFTSKPKDVRDGIFYSLLLAERQWRRVPDETSVTVAAMKPGLERLTWEAARVVAADDAAAIALRREIAAYRTLLTVLSPTLVMFDGEEPRTPHGDALILRTARGCGADYAEIATWVARGCNNAEKRPEAIRTIAARCARITAAVRADAALAKLLLPHLAVWGREHAYARAFGYSMLVGPALRVASWHAHDPDAAARAEAAFLAAIDAFATALPADPKPPYTYPKPTWEVAPRLPVNAVTEQWTAIATAWAAWAGRCAASGELIAMDATTASALMKDAVLQAKAWEQVKTGSGATSPLLAQLGGHLVDAASAVAEAARHQKIIAGEDGTPAATAARRERALALGRLGVAKAGLAVGQRDLMTVVAACGGPQQLPALTAHLGLGDPPTAGPTAGGDDPLLAADEALLAAGAATAEPWRQALELLISRRKAGEMTATIAARWQRLLRRRVALQALQAHPDHAAMISDARRGGAVVSAGLASAGDPGPLSAAVAAWTATIARPVAGRMRPVASSEAALLREIAVQLAAEAPPGWGILVDRIDDEATLNRFTAILALRLRPEHVALADDAAELTLLVGHPVVAALARITADRQRLPNETAAAQSAILPAVGAWLRARAAAAKPKEAR